MAASKTKNTKNDKGGTQSHIRARLAYLNNAALYLHHQRVHQSTTKQKRECQTNNGIEATQTSQTSETSQTSINQARMPRHYINQMRNIALKTQQRLSQDTKRSFCKRCDLLLTPGVTCTEEIENKSKDCKKPWADVLVIRCLACQTVKRIPQNQQRSVKLSIRKQGQEKKNATASSRGVEAKHNS